MTLIRIEKKSIFQYFKRVDRSFYTSATAYNIREEKTCELENCY